MGETPAPPPSPQHRGRSWRLLIAKGAGLAVLLMLLLSLSWMTRPRQVADLILARVGSALDLQITSGGAAEYHLRGTPRLVVRDLVARQPGSDTPLLTAERVYLSLPWSSLRAAGSGAAASDLTVRRVEIDSPHLELAALQRWRAGRPAAPEVRIPTLTEGLQISDGTVAGDGWSIDRLGLEMPALHPDRPLVTRVAGRFVNGDTTVPFDLQVALTRPAAGAGLGAAGIATVATPGWRLPMQMQLSGRLHDGVDGVGLDRFKLGADARYLGGDQPLPFVYGLAGPLRYDAGRFTIAPLGTAVRGQGAIPVFDAHGAFAWQDGMDLQLEGRLADWPNRWPTLPAPLDQSSAPLPFALDYRGPANLSGATSLHLRRDGTRLDVDFRLPRLLDWLDQIATGTPLPPLDGHLSSTRLEVSGAVLEGVEIEFEDAGATP